MREEYILIRENCLSMREELTKMEKNYITVEICTSLGIAIHSDERGI